MVFEVWIFPYPRIHSIEANRRVKVDCMVDGRVIDEGTAFDDGVANEWIDDTVNRIASFRIFGIVYRRVGIPSEGGVYNRQRASDGPDLERIKVRFRLGAVSAAFDCKYVIFDLRDGHDLSANVDIKWQTVFCKLLRLTYNDVALRIVYIGNDCCCNIVFLSFVATYQDCIPRVVNG